MAKAMQQDATQEDLRAAVVAACGVELSNDTLVAEMGTVRAQAANGALASACAQFRESGQLAAQATTG